MSFTRDLTIEHMSISALKPWTKNARTHSKKQIAQIGESIRTFGFTNPVLIDNENRILAGHGRVAAARLLKMDKVPCVRLENMSAEQKRAYVIADNKLALNAGWDEALLAEELASLVAVDIGFDISVTGFSIPEIDHLIEGLHPVEPGDPADERLPDLAEGPAISSEGDLWQLGEHRLLCGDARKGECFEMLMGGERARMIFTDPPYNVPIDGYVGGSGKVQHREFPMASGEMTPKEFQEFLRQSLNNLATFSLDGSIHYICMDWRHMGDLLEAGSSIYSELKNLCIWAKDNGGMGTFYRSRHELIFVFKNGTKPHINNFELGQHGRYRTNVWEYRGVNTLKAGRMDELTLHPTVKPVAMIADAIKDVTRRNDIVLDAFSGSGSTIVAAHKTGRRCYAVELDPVYVDRSIRRWQQYAHDDAIHMITGETFQEAATKRFGDTSDQPQVPLARQEPHP